MQADFVTLKNVFANKELSENAKFLCYSLVVGMNITEVFELKDKLKNKKTEQEESTWEFKFNCLIYWYEDILSREEIINGFKELKENNMYVRFDIEDALRWEREKYE